MLIKMPYKDVDWNVVDIRKLYIENKMLTREIAAEYNIPKAWVEKRMRELNISGQDKKNSYTLNKDQHDVLIGSILGDGAFVFAKRSVNPILKFAHNSDQLDYLKFKHELFKEFCVKDKGIREYKNKKFTNRKPMHDINTKALPVFLKYSKLDRTEVIEQLSPTSLLIWYLDDGSLDAKNMVSITCASFSLEECMKAIHKINELIGINGKIIRSKREKNGFQGFWFNRHDTKELFKYLKRSKYYEELKSKVEYKFVNFEEEVGCQTASSY